MDPTLIAFMLGISIILGLFGLLFFIWALRGGQFDDENKMLQGLLYDDTSDLNSAAKKSQKEKKETESKNSD
ncbi:MAG: cbb3-type cytochrome oxidase assembly protein CcoS [Campylobacterales bacterium]